MGMRMGRIEEFSFSAEDDSATACAGALRKVKSLADIAPLGRLFDSISTLSEAANDISRSLSANDMPGASQKMKAYAAPAALAEDVTPLPIHFRKRR
jgi:hypothetical protein